MSVLALPLLGWDLSLDAAIIGATTGLTYAVLGAGLVLLYRATGILNLAHGEVGTLAGAILARLVLQDRWNYWVALVVCTAIGLAVGALTELLVMRRLARASKLVLLAATLGLAQVLLVLQTMVPTVDEAAPYPTGFRTSVDVAGVTLFGEHLVVLAVVPAVILGLGAFLTRSRYGLAIRASADNPSAARLAGMSPRRVSLLVWSIAGAVSALTYMLNAPVRGTISGVAAEGLGPSLLLRALAAALVGRFVSLPLTLVGGVAVGVVESQAFVNVAPGTVDAVVFVIVAVLVLTRMRSDDDGTAAVDSTGGAPPIASWLPRPLRVASALVGIAAVVLLPVLVTSPSQHVLFARVAIYAIVAVSVVVVTGWSGQLSLCQFAFVGLGAVLVHAFTARGMGYGWACLYAGCAGVIAAIVVGLPALRVRGFFLAVTTLGFAVAATGWLLPHERLFGDGNVAYVERGSIGPFDITSQRSFYYLAVVVLAGVAFVAHRLRASGIGRTLLAVRENERSAEAMTISAVRSKLLAFGVAGGFAALAGALLGGLTTQFQASDFPPAESLRVVAMTIIGGVGSIAGGIAGAVFVLGVPALLEDSLAVRMLTSGIGLLVVLLIQPGGLLELLRQGAAAVARRVGAPPAATTGGPEATPPTVATVARRDVRRPDGTEAEAPALVVSGVTVRFGGLVAVNDVSIEARRGESVGLIGTNGAGKSTLLNAISGFVRASAGTIAFDGTPLDPLAPHERARLGIGRVFQDARLYPDLTPRESIAVALEAAERSELVPSALWLPPSRQAEWRKRRRTGELVEALGLGPIADRRIAELSTGSRRLVEIACLLAVDARLLLLDEPMAGVAHHETQRFVSLIADARRELDATVLIIEHDMSVIMAMSDRLYCMAAGQVIAHGRPEDVRGDPGVVAAYLGGAPAPPPARRRHRVARREPLVAR